ncbi:MAG: AAA family ATPase [Treponema phagedenis]|uniref:AAA family ATPase n=1 Tax=Treponema phagedenis TaxID=162 RepID=UPI0031340BB3
MQIVKVKNFGPIGENKKNKDGFFTVHISPVTVFIGETASGKSAVAKLCSIFLWFEKKLMRMEISGNLNIKVFKNLCRQQEMGDYFSSDTVLIYEGDAFIFEYNERNKTITKTAKEDSSDYVLPKIQYVSAARNLLTILYEIHSSVITSKDGNILTFSSNIPFMVNDLNTEYMRALGRLAKNGFSLPIEKTAVFYKNHCPFIEADKKKIPMSAASSGIQSMTPLLLVSEFLSREVKKDLFEKLQDTNENLKNKIRNELNKKNYDNLIEKFNLYCMGGRKILEQDADVEVLETIIKKFIPSCFINIVEEPEQNLYPASQGKVLYKLLESMNVSEHNQLIITTHSPYMLSYLTLAAKAAELFDKSVPIDRITKTVPEASMVPGKKITIYEMKSDGSIECLSPYAELPSDGNVLNKAMAEGNSLFADLLELEQEFCE